MKAHEGFLARGLCGLFGLFVAFLPPFSAKMVSIITGTTLALSRPTPEGEVVLSDMVVCLIY